MQIVKDINEILIYQDSDLSNEQYTLIKANPDFSTIDIENSWTNIDPGLFQGMLLSVTVIHNETSEVYVRGSAILAYSEYCFCALHVLEEFLDGMGRGEYSVYLTGFYPDKYVMWRGTKFQAFKGFDIGMLEITPTFKASDVPAIYCPEMDFVTPSSGDNIVIAGTIATAPVFNLKENKVKPVSVESRLCKGAVLDVFPNGRDTTMMPMPCISIDTPSWGGMSGGPAFNTNGDLIGIISSSIEASPTTISLILHPDSPSPTDIMKKPPQ